MTQNEFYRKQFGTLGFTIFIFLFLLAAGSFARAEEPIRGVIYTNHLNFTVPWSVHIVKVERNNPEFQFYAAHAEGKALGLSTLSEQLKTIPQANGIPVAAVNGDFYQRDRAHAGDPRGLQIINGELISGPVGGTAFWIDAVGEPHIEKVVSKFEITSTNGFAAAFGLNGPRHDYRAELYTFSAGPRTQTRGGRELVLELIGNGSSLPLRANHLYDLKIQQIIQGGDALIPSKGLVLSLPPRSDKPAFKPNEVLRLSTECSPSLRGVKTAISGGPILVRNGKAQKIPRTSSESYEASSMFERHPRSAVGWNDKFFFLVEVDGRHKKLSVGMTLEELGAFMARLGCQEAMTLDGGGSATFWYNGRIRNRPCDGHEREIANALVILKKSVKHPNPRALNN